MARLITTTSSVSTRTAIRRDLSPQNATVSAVEGPKGPDFRFVPPARAWGGTGSSVPSDPRERNALFCRDDGTQVAVIIGTPPLRQLWRSQGPVAARMGSGDLPRGIEVDR